MPRPVSSALTDYELAIMKILWTGSPLSVADILSRFPRKPRPAYTSMLTAIQNMERKGYLRHDKEGKAYLYAPVLKQEPYRRSQVKKLVRSLFGGDVVGLAVNLMKEEKLGPDEIGRLKKLLEEL